MTSNTLLLQRFAKDRAREKVSDSEIGCRVGRAEVEYALNGLESNGLNDSGIIGEHLAEGGVLFEMSLVKH